MSSSSYLLTPVVLNETPKQSDSAQLFSKYSSEDTNVFLADNCDIAVDQRTQEENLLMCYIFTIRYNQ